MAKISTVESLIAAVGAHAGAARPIEAMTRAGFEFSGVPAQAIARGRSVPAVDPGILARMNAQLGPTPPVRVRVRASAPQAVARRAGRFAATASLDLAVANEVLAELWRVNTLKQELSASITAQLVTLASLRDLCTGVPEDADAAIGSLRFVSPPVLRPAADRVFLRLDAAFDLPVTGASPSSLRGVAHADIPLLFETVLDTERNQQRVRLALAATQAVATIDVDPNSPIRPRSEGAERDLEQRITRGVQLALLLNLNKISIPASIALPGPLNTGAAVIRQTAAACVTNGGRSILTAGFNIEPQSAAIPAQLANEAAPTAPANIRMGVDEEFVNEALGALITSGELERTINDKTPSGVPTIRVRRGRVQFRNGLMEVALDCTAKDACAFGKDLGFRATASVRATVFEGQLKLETSSLDFDLDNTDAIVCTLLGGLLGPFGLILSVTVLTVLAVINPSLPDASAPVATDTPPLPGSEQRLHVELLQAQVGDGSLITSGVARMEADTEHTFVYLKLVSGGRVPALQSPLAEAEVKLLELDRPAPAGDDVNIPPTSESETIVKRTLVLKSTTYEPLPDRLLGTQKTDTEGLVRFIVKPDSRAGTLTRTELREDLSSGRVISSRTSHTPVGGDRPDLGVTVTDRSGNILATRKLIQLNLAGKRLGTRENPVVVQVGRAIPPILGDVTRTGLTRG